MELFNCAYDAVTQCNEPMYPRDSAWRGKRENLLQKATGQDLKLILKISSLLEKKSFQEEDDIVMASRAVLEAESNSDDSQKSCNTSNTTKQRLRRTSTQSGASVARGYALTDEERETFLAEGLSVPKVVPFTKAEERTLKKIRRKIKNKISAQESRRKKKEYVEGLEKRVQQSDTENRALQDKVDTLERTVRGLLCELNRLRHLSTPVQQKTPSHSIGTQTGTCLKCLMKKNLMKNEPLPACDIGFKSINRQKNTVPNIFTQDRKPSELTWKEVKSEDNGFETTDEVL